MPGGESKALSLLDNIATGSDAIVPSGLSSMGCQLEETLELTTADIGSV
jgi:hypothetical protein